jgi:ABC-type Fe3+/spermidine/putrescine transport system ATPase subunit
MATGPAIEATGLVKALRRDARALAGVDLDVPRGAVLSLLGPERRRQDDHGARSSRR